jgi:HK97 family phage major capsid protein
MTAEEIVAALNDLLAAAVADDGEPRPLTDEEAERVAELEGQLKMVERDAELRSRVRAYNTPVRTDVHVNVAGADRPDPQMRAFTHYLRTGEVNSDLAEFRAQSEGTNVGEIVAEGGTFAAGADLVFASRALSAYKYMAGGAGNTPLKVSWELVQDAEYDIVGLLTRKLGERIARIQAVHWATGTGTGQPQGLVTPLTTIGAIANNTTGPTYAELLATVLALDPAYRAGAEWVMNDATYGKIMGLVDTTGRPLVNQSVDSISGRIGQATLMGYPVVVDQAMPSAAAGAKFLVFGDIGEAYVIRRVKDVTLVTLNELYAANGQTGYMAWARADGAVQNPNAAVVRTAAA